MLQGNLTLLALGLFFIASHLGMSSLLRPTLAGNLGERGYLGLYSLVALVSIVLLSMSYGDNGHHDYLWQPTRILMLIPWIVMPFAVFFVVGGLVAPNPTNVGMEEVLEKPEAATGVLRITRHPTQTGIFLWAAGHLLANPDLASLIFFGSFVVVSGWGMVLMDRRKRTSGGEHWQRFESATSVFPGVAILKGANRLVISELYLPVVVSAVLFVAFIYTHNWLSGGIVLL